MTIIAWDGAILAADKATTNQGYSSTVTKIFRVPNGRAGFTGGSGHCARLLAWFNNGRNPADYPHAIKEDDGGVVLFINDTLGLVELFGTNEPVSFKIEQAFTAIGSGRDYALAAMHLGQSAVDAVLVASHFDAYCGNGIDVLHKEIHRAR